MGGVILSRKTITQLQTMALHERRGRHALATRRLQFGDAQQTLAATYQDAIVHADDFSRLSLAGFGRGHPNATGVIF